MPYKEGDIVKVTTKDEIIEGILLPRPELLKGDAVIIKLDSGYNIGIDKKKIKKIELVKKLSQIKQPKNKIKNNPRLPKVSILSYGGTISSKVDYRTGGADPDVTAEDFVEMLPELKEIANLKAKKMMSEMTENFDFKIWEKMAKDVESELNSGADGVVLTQGTDTFHYTTAALSFFLKDATKPVIVTASQRSIDRGSSDAFLNLVCAVKAAAEFDGSGVYSCMHGTSDDEYCLLLRGCKIRKMHTSRRDAFRPINEMPIAKVYAEKKIEVINRNYKKRTDKKFKADTKHERKVAMVFVYPGMDAGILDFYLKKGYKGIILMATALGHVPIREEYSPINSIKRANKAGVPVVIASQTLYGRVHPLVYTNLRRLSLELDVIFAEDMLPETAYVKLGWVLGHTKDPEKVKEMMLTSVAGEINDKIPRESFLY